MRLDKYLKVSRIIKRRTVANQACDTEHVEVNGRRAKASYDVKPGDIVAVTYGERTLKFKVLDIREHVAKADAASMYEIISE
ncbi:MAG: RNA-binding S4 domain-containing protein [Clostridia bacterium]|nr:RNA-binding S4 domain-containing protein [Clostridia bacterium]